MKTLYIIGGVLFALFAFAQLLQLLGLIGVGSSIAGVGFTILGGVLSYLCFAKALSRPQQGAHGDTRVATDSDFVGIYENPETTEMEDHPKE
jgi:hypothetical protein